MSDAQPRLRLPFVLGVLAIAAAILGMVVVIFPKPVAPTATWHFGEDRSTVEPFDKVPGYDAMTLELDLPWAGYVYVVSFDHRQGTIGYFPSEYLGTDHDNHHFEAGTHELPGKWQDKSQAWFVPDVKEALSLCVVFSREPLKDLEALLKLTMQIGNTAFPDKSMGRYMPRAGRDQRIGRNKLPHEVLRAAQNQPGAIEGGPMVPWARNPHVYLKVLNIVPGKPRPGATPPSNPLKDRLKKMVREKKEGK